MCAHITFLSCSALCTEETILCGEDIFCKHSYQLITVISSLKSVSAVKLSLYPPSVTNNSAVTFFLFLVLGSNYCQHSMFFFLVPSFTGRYRHGRPQGGARGSGRSPWKIKKKKKFEKKMYKQNFLTCKRPPSYVMRRNFLTKGPHVMH